MEENCPFGHERETTREYAAGAATSQWLFIHDNYWCILPVEGFEYVQNRPERTRDCDVHAEMCLLLRLTEDHGLPKRLSKKMLRQILTRR